MDARVPRRRVLLVASAGAFLAFLDATIVNVAFPSIRESFSGTSIGDLSWVLNAYNIVFAAFLVVCGRLADLLGRRRMFIAGIALFTLASAACGLATSVDVLVAARVAQALGSALLVPASLALVVEAFPPERRSHAIGLWGATAALAAGLGPPVGGALVELGGWRWAFLVNLPLGLAAVLAARSQLVESRAPGRRRMPDLRGAALLAASLGLVNLAIVKGADWGWVDGTTLGVFAVSALLLGGFVLSSKNHRSPLLDPALLRLRSFTVANVATVLAGFGFFAYLLTNILWLQYVWGYGVLRAGLALVPGALVAAVVASRLGPVAERRGYRVVLVPGALVWAGAYLWYHQKAGTSPDFVGAWLPGQVLSGIGAGATLPVLGSAALAAVPGGRFATASALVSSTRQLGGVLGIAVLVVVVGTPTPTTVVGLLRDGWTLSIVSFVLVAICSLPLGRVQPAQQTADEEDGVPQVHLPVTQARRVLSLDGPAVAGIFDVPLFADLPVAARRRLAATAVSVDLPAGAVLMDEGSTAEAVYVLQTGRLEVLIGGRLVRELGPGAVLGELAVLTGELRSATVRARRDATLLSFAARDFLTLLDEDASASRVVLTQLADRLRDAVPTEGARPSRPAVVAVVGLNRGASARAVAAAVEARLAQTRRVVQLDGAAGAGAVERAERDGALVLLVADADDDQRWRTSCLRSADQVLLVAPTGTAPQGAGDVQLAISPDLVLVGPRPTTEQLAAWSDAVQPWRTTLAADLGEGALAAALRPVADRIAGRSVGLVLAGGGARALTHVGVLRELEESGIVVDRVAGCSVGAIIAAVWATGVDGAGLDAMTYAELVRRRPFSDYTLPLVSLARGRRMAAGLHRAFGESLIEAQPRSFACVSTDLSARSRHVHRTGGLAAAVCASASLPVLLPPRRSGDLLLVDGGILDNLPVQLLTERDEGPVVAVNIAMGGAPRPAAAPGAPVRPPRVPALGETLLRTMMIGSGGAVATARELGAVVVTPSPGGVGLLEFHQFDRMVEAGRSAARALLETTGGDLTTPTVDLQVPSPRRSSMPVAPRAGVRRS